MNTILLKRIVEAAENNEQRYNVGEEHGYLYTHKGDIKGAVIYGAIFALQNQWISVEEALPEKMKDKNYSKYVLARQEYYEHEYHVIARYDYNFKMWVSTTYFKPEFITHWMPIPSLEGGEE